MSSTRKKLYFVLFLFFPFLLKSKVNAQDKITRIAINATGGLQYDLVRFKIKPGVRVRIVLTNKGDMPHNLVMTQPDSRTEVVEAALKLGENGPTLHYVPKLSKVIGFIKTLSPGEADSITFTAPSMTGVYPYVCTYPGHGSIMFGAMYVTDKDMPIMKDDPYIPLERRKDANTSMKKESHIHNREVSQAPHPYKQTPPYMYRIFIPEASPAAIAVNLPKGLSYCWDAGVCRLRYAWKGGFLDNTDIWKGHYDSYAEILGTIFYRDKTEYPLHVDKLGNIPTVKFKGYRLIDRYPEFHYTINGVDVFELLRSKEDGTGLIRAFRMPNNKRLICFVTSEDDGVHYEASEGTWANGVLTLLPAETREFKITMTIKR